MATVAEAEDDIELVSEDGENLESDWHRLEIGLLAEMVRNGWHPPASYYVAGNMFIYFSAQQARNRDFRGPDFFLVKNVSPHLRPYWVTWREGGRFPDLIIELMAASTKQEDLTTKKQIYETTFRTPDLFCYDPDTPELLGWRLVGGRYDALIPNDKGWLGCEELGFWLGLWDGVYLGHRALWLRFFDKDSNVVPTLGEAAALQAEAERRRAEAAETELARLRAQHPPSPNGE